jgi:hypothetical protein
VEELAADAVRGRHHALPYHAGLDTRCARRTRTAFCAKKAS